MYNVTLFRQFASQKEYRTIRVQDLASVQSYCVSGWRCINYTKAY